MPITPDGYPAPPDGPGWQWDGYRKITWKDSKKGNLYMAKIGERSFPGLKGFLQDISKGAVSWLASGLTMLITGLPIPGIDQLSGELKKSLQKGIQKEISHQMGSVLKKLQDKYGSKFPLHVDLLVLVDKQQMSFYRNEYAALGAHDKTCVMHYILDRWSDYANTIITYDFAHDKETKKTYTTVLSALGSWDLNFRTHPKLASMPGYSGDWREFFAGEGVGRTFCGLISEKKRDWRKQSDVDLMRKVANAVALLKVTTDKNEYEDWKNDVNEKMNTIKKEMEKKNIQAGILSSKAGLVAGIGSLLTLGMLLSKK